MVKVGRQKLSAVGAGSFTPTGTDSSSRVDARTGEILGAHMVGNRACDMIPELVATMALEGGYQELERDDRWKTSRPAAIHS